jgi:hypothetical protein
MTAQNGQFFVWIWHEMLLGTGATVVLIIAMVVWVQVVGR